MMNWALVIVAITVPLISGAIAYGIATGASKARINGIAHRLDVLEGSVFITRDEYESRHLELRTDMRVNHDNLMDMLQALLRKTQ